MDCINVNFDNLDNIYLLDTVFNISNYNGLPFKNSSVVNDILRNNAVSGISLNKEFTPSTKYILEFDYYTSASNCNGFYFGADPSLEDGVSINNSDTGLHIVVDISNTYVETFNGTSFPTNVYTHTSNLFTSGTHHIRIVRNNTNVTFYIDDVELYTYTNAKYNTIGLNKWGGGYNTISIDSLDNSITNLEYDTGWQTITITNNKFAHYNNDQILQIRKVGRIVELTGSLRSTSNMTLNATEVKVATIPTEYRPTNYIFGLMQGTQTSVFLVTINMSNGALNVSRYRSSTTYSSVASGSWFPIHLTWIV